MAAVNVPPPRVSVAKKATRSRSEQLAWVAAIGSVICCLGLVAIVTLMLLVRSPRVPATSEAAPNTPVADASSIEATVARTEASIAHVVKGIGFGSGFLVAPRWIVTNRHVISRVPHRDVRVAFPSATSGTEFWKVRLIAVHPLYDLALLQTDRDGPPLAIAEDYRFRRGQEVLAIGNPGSDVQDTHVSINAVSRGIMSTEARVDGLAYYQLDMAVNPGNSGGPLLDLAGTVVGVITLRSPEKQAHGFAIPASAVAALVKQAQQASDEEIQRCGAMHDARVLVSVMQKMNYCCARAFYGESTGDRELFDEALSELDSLEKLRNANWLELELRRLRNASGLTVQILSDLELLLDNSRLLRDALKSGSPLPSSRTVSLWKTNTVLFEQLSTDLEMLPCDH
jgi:S1-C subfamily serine protease